jgi:hypothetical protein
MLDEGNMRRFDSGAPADQTKITVVSRFTITVCDVLWDGKLGRFPTTRAQVLRDNA